MALLKRYHRNNVSIKAASVCKGHIKRYIFAHSMYLANSLHLTNFDFVSKIMRLASVNLVWCTSYMFVYFILFFCNNLF